MGQDGSGASEVTPDTAGGFAVSPDGRWLVFQGKQSTDHLGLQLKNLDDGTERALTQNVTAQTPSFFPDGKRVAFSLYDKKLSIYEVTVNGGQPQLLSGEDRSNSTPSVSPSGKFVAFIFNRAQNAGTQTGIAILDAETKQVISRHPVKINAGSPYEAATLQWSTDETEVYFVQLDNSVSNIMRLKLADGSVSNLTSFPDGRIFNFAVEPNGTRILVARGQVERDAVLLRSAE
jgi:Tol biopolymer transport system component